MISNSNLLRQIMSDHAQSEAVVLAYEEYMALKEGWIDATELFQDSGDDAEMSKMLSSFIHDSIYISGIIRAAHVMGNDFAMQRFLVGLERLRNM